MIKKITINIIALLFAINCFSQTVEVLRIPTSEVDSIKGTYGLFSEINPISIGGGYYVIPARCRYDQDLKDSWIKYDSLQGSRYTWNGSSYVEFTDTNYMFEFEITYNDTVYPYLIDSASYAPSTTVKYFTGSEWNIDSSYLVVSGSNANAARDQHILVFDENLTPIDTFTIDKSITYVAQGITWNTDSSYYVLTGTRSWYPAGDPVNVQNGATGYTLYGTMVTVSPNGNFIDTLQHPYDPYGSQYTQTGMLHYNPIDKRYLWSAGLYPLYLDQDFSRTTDLVGYMKDENDGDIASGEGITEHWITKHYWGTGVYLGGVRLVKNDSLLNYELDTVAYPPGAEDLCVNHSDNTIFISKDKSPNNLVFHVNPNGTHKRIINLFGIRGFRCKLNNCTFDSERFTVDLDKQTGTVITPVIDFGSYTLQQDTTNIRINDDFYGVTIEYRGSDTAPTVGSFDRLHLPIYDANQSNDGWGETEPSVWQLTPTTYKYQQYKITLIK